MKKFLNKKNMLILTIFMVFLVIDNVNALETTPEYCFKYASYPVEDCDEVCTEICIDGECMPECTCGPTKISYTIEISDYTCFEGNPDGHETITDVVIPTSFHGINTDDISTYIISDNAFAGKNLTSVVLPENLAKIKNKAFFGNFLKKVIIPSNVKEIGKMAFANNQITTVINKSTIDNETLMDNIGSEDAHQLIFASECTSKEDIFNCSGSNTVKIYNSEDEYINANKDNVTKEPITNNEQSIDNPKTLDSNNSLFIIMSLLSTICILILIMKNKNVKLFK